jgi:hypothetical protein
LAGAYLLRALAEAHLGSRLAFVAAGIVYAAAWLYLAFRVREKNGMASTVYSVTCAAIFAPLLWEATVRFGVLPPAVTAVLLAGFAATSSAAPVVTLSALATAMALMIGTGSMVPFAVALLVIACLAEAAFCGGRRVAMRAPTAIAADFAIWLLIYIMTSPASARGEYQAVDPAVSVALCGALFAIFAGAISWRVLVRGLAVTYLDIGESAVAFPLAVAGSLQLTQGGVAVYVGVLCAVACAACYAARRVFFAWWGAAFGLAAGFLVVPGSLLTLLLSAGSVAAIVLRAWQPVLASHGVLCLIAAAATSGIPRLAVNAFLGSRLETATPALGIAAVGAVCCYLAWGRQAPRVSAICALLAGGLAGALAILFVRPPDAMLATVRTFANCALAIGFAFSGARSGRRELVWIGYTAIATGGLKLLFDDLRHSGHAALAVSLVCYGATLIVIPRIARFGAQAQPPDSVSR